MLFKNGEKICEPFKVQINQQNLHKRLFKQKASGTLCDVQVSLQGSIFWGHACVFSSCSFYFKELFQSHWREEHGWENHWCARNPLVVDLDKLVLDEGDKCETCVSKVIDFMYLREVVVMEGHFKHFSKVAYLLKVFDLFPICRKYYTARSCEQANKSSVTDKNLKHSELNIGSNFKEEHVNEIGSNVVLNAKSNYSRDTLTIKSCKVFPSNIQPELICEAIGFEEKCTQDKCNGVSYNQNEQFDSLKSSELQSFDLAQKSHVIAEEHNYGIKTKETLSSSESCKFVCCRKEKDVFHPTRKKYKRKITCEICSFTSISVKKILKHVESFNHVKTFCPICKLSALNIKDLKEHLKKHNSSRPYFCQFCNKQSRFWEDHELHLKDHCRNKKFCCKVCQKSFNRYQNMANHLNTHEKCYFCKFCNCQVSDVDHFKSHPLEHNTNVENKVEETPILNDNVETTHDNNIKNHLSTKKFGCNICGERFTQKKNLKRHAQLTHLNVQSYKCSKCIYTSKRTDLLKCHMVKQHNSTAEEIAELTHNKSKKVCKKSKPEEQTSQIVGVMIPVQLVSTVDSSTLTAFAVKTGSSVRSESKLLNSNCNIDYASDQNKNEDEFVCNSQPENQQQTQNTLVNEINIDLSKTVNEINIGLSETVSEINIGLSKTMHKTTSAPSVSTNALINNNKKQSSALLKSNNQLYLSKEFNTHVTGFENVNNNSQLCLPPEILTFDSKVDTKRFGNIFTQAEELRDFHDVLEEGIKNTENKDYKSNILSTDGDFLLNEATGEFLNGNSFANIHLTDPNCSLENIASTSNPTSEISASICSLIVNNTSKGVSVYDFEKDIDDFQSNPQTPQTNLVELDDADNFFSWSYRDNSLCSTWVLNEATGELNMVSFSVQQLKNCDELKLDESTGVFSSLEDDETALFLNEGTGDLSVIYFNPKPSFNENINQENLESFDNMSEHSNDDDEDLLNEEFFKATASFMAHEENEIFLNELTGEFNIAHFDDHQTHISECQISRTESYLNEETGEISWNVLDKNICSDLFTSSDNFTYDFDDSLNCDDFDSFPGEIGDISSHFCLDSSTSSSWHPIEDDTLLNECTGELVKKC